MKNISTRIVTIYSLISLFALIFSITLTYLLVSLGTDGYNDSEVIMCILSFLSSLSILLVLYISYKIRLEFTVFADVFYDAVIKSKKLEIQKLSVREFRILGDTINSMLDEKQKFEKDLITQERVFRSFIEQADDYIMIKDLEGRYILVNDKFAGLFGKESKLIEGRTPEELGYSNEQIDFFNQTDNTVLELRKAVRVEFKSYFSQLEGIGWLEEIVFPVFDEKGEIFLIGVLARDITKRKRYEEELELQNEKLKKAYEDLKNSQELIIKQEKLASLGTMFAGIAHEINNPVQAIKFSLDMLEMDVADIIKLLQAIKSISNKDIDSSLKLQHIIDTSKEIGVDDIIDELTSYISDNFKMVERIDTILKSTKRMVHADLSFTDCYIEDIINDSLTLLHNSIKDKVQIEKDIEKDIPKFKGAVQDLSQVFINLIQNATDSIEEKGHNNITGLIKINVVFDRWQEGISISIEDNGTGIKKEIQSKIFDPFFTTKSIGKGTGQGLGICYRVITAHNGKIDFESEVGKGTKFKVWLPLSQKIEQRIDNND